MIQDPRKKPDRHQNLSDFSPGHAPSLQKISSKSVRIFFDISHAHRIWRLHNLFGGGYDNDGRDLCNINNNMSNN